MRPIVLTGLVLLSACASQTGGTTLPPGSGPATVYENTRIASNGTSDASMDRDVQSTKFVSSATIAQPLDAVWGALPDIWAALGLTVDGISPKDHRLQSGIIRVRRQLGKVSLSRYVDCGRSTIGPNADSYFIALKVETVLSGKDGAVVIQSALQATGEGTGNGGQNMRCSSTGELENRIADRIATRLK